MILNYFAIPGLKVNVHNETLQNLIMVVCIAMNINPKKLLSKSRKRDLVNARGMCYMILRQRNPSFTLKQIGECFGRDHTTIMNGIRNTSSEITYNETLHQHYLTIQSRL